MKKKFDVKNLDCGDCAKKIEAKIKEIDGVESVKVNFLMRKLTIEANEENLERILEESEKLARKIEPDFEIVR